MLDEYSPGAIFIILPGSATLIASWIVLNGPDSLSIGVFKYTNPLCIRPLTPYEGYYPLGS